MDIEIRQYNKATDAQQLRQCVIGLQDFERRLDPRMPSGESIADDYLQEMFLQCRQFAGSVFIGEQDEKIAGYITILTKYVSDDIDDGPRKFGFITDVFVDEKFRGQGIGRALLKHAENHARENGVSEMMIGVLASNHQARSLYLTQGFEEFAIKLEKKL